MISIQAVNVTSFTTVLLVTILKIVRGIPAKSVVLCTISTLRVSFFAKLETLFYFVNQVSQGV